MHSHDSILNTVIRKITTEYLNGVLLEPTEDISDLSDGKRNSMKKQAERILVMDVFRWCLRSVVNQNKNVLLLQANTEQEIMLARGQILGLKNLENALSTWAARTKSQEINEEE